MEIPLADRSVLLASIRIAPMMAQFQSLHGGWFRGEVIPRRTTTWSLRLKDPHIRQRFSFNGLGETVSGVVIWWMVNGRVWTRLKGNTIPRLFHPCTPLSCQIVWDEKFVARRNISSLFKGSNLGCIRYCSWFGEGLGESLPEKMSRMKWWRSGTFSV